MKRKKSKERIYMNRMIKKAGILLGIFAAAVAVYIVGNQRLRVKMQEQVIYTAFGETTLPVVYVEMFGREMNPMYGYRQDMGNTAARDSLTILPPDRGLPIQDRKSVV